MAATTKMRSAAIWRQLMRSASCMLPAPIHAHHTGSVQVGQHHYAGEK
jgi:hypothetical protein